MISNLQNVDQYNKHVTHSAFQRGVLSTKSKFTSVSALRSCYSKSFKYADFYDDEFH